MKIKDQCEICKTPITQKVAEANRNLCSECLIECKGDSLRENALFGNHVGGAARRTQMFENGDTDFGG